MYAVLVHFRVRFLLLLSSFFVHHATSGWNALEKPDLTATLTRKIKVEKAAYFVVWSRSLCVGLMVGHSFHGRAAATAAAPATAAHALVDEVLKQTAPCTLDLLRVCLVNRDQDEDFEEDCASGYNRFLF